MSSAHLACRSIGSTRDADDLDVALVELGLDLGHVAELGGANRREVLGVREQHGPGVPDPVVELDAAGGGVGLEVGRGVADAKRHRSISSTLPSPQDGCNGGCSCRVLTHSARPAINPNQPFDVPRTRLAAASRLAGELARPAHRAAAQPGVKTLASNLATTAVAGLTSSYALAPSLAARRAVQFSVRIMLSGTAGPAKQTSLMAEYSSLLADSVLRHKAWLAEHTRADRDRAGEQGQVRIHRQHEP